MTEKNEFDFEEESDGFDPQGDGGGFDFDEPLPEDEGGGPGKKKKRTSPVLLLLLLLIAAGAGAYYYFFMLPEPSPPPVVPKVVKKQPIAIPPRPAPPETQKAAEPAPEGKDQPVQEVTQKPVVSEKTAEVAAPVVEEKKTPAAKPVAEAPAAKKDTEEKPAPVEPVKVESAKVEKAVPVPAVEATPPAESSKAVSTSSRGVYTVQAGAFTRNSSLERARKLVEKLGYEPKVTAAQRQVEMIRLRLGAFFPPEGREKLQQILPLAPDAFSVQKGELMVIYAASFQDPRRAEKFEASLMEKGLHVDEERSPVDIQMMMLSFGEFGDKAEAQKAADAAKKVGLETMITRLKK